MARARKPRLVINAAVAGFFLCFAFLGFVQDLAGKEEWMAFVDRDWVDMSPWIWPPIMLIIITTISLLARTEYRLIKEPGHGHDRGSS